MIGIIDYGAGNLASVNNAFEHLGYEAIVFKEPEKILEFERVILPGVGSFHAAMENLTDIGWTDAIKKYADTNKPILGICLGMQLLFEQGDEHGLTDGLGLIDGSVVRLEPMKPNKIPHVGWNNLTHVKQHPLFEGIKPQVDFYFVHSYHCVANNADNILATCDFGDNFIASVAHNSIVGMQFHPEKSHKFGMKIIKQFLNL